MNKFLVFFYAIYYPDGGIADLVATALTLEQAHADFATFYNNTKEERGKSDQEMLGNYLGHIYDVELMKIVWAFGSFPHKQEFLE